MSIPNSINLCEYSTIFGSPNTGLHRYRVFNLAIVDIILTVILAYVIYHITKYNFFVILIVCFIIGIIAHRLFCVRTTIDKLLFPNP